MTFEINFNKIIQGLLIAGITAIIIMLWNIDGRVRVLEKQQNIVERVERLENAMLPVLVSWKVEEELKKIEEELGDTEVEEEEEMTPVSNEKKKEIIRREAEEWANNQIMQQRE